MATHTAARDSEAAQIDSASLASAVHTLCDNGFAHEALQVARYLVVKSPELAVVQTAYGRALFETGETVTASDVLSRAAVQFPYAVAVHRWLAECLLQQGGTARARAVVEKALGLAPNNPRIRELANQTQVLDNAPIAPGAWLQDAMADDETTARIFSIQTRARVDVRPPVGNNDPTVIGPAPTRPSYVSPVTARNPRPRTTEFDAVDPTSTEELPSLTASGQALSAIWQQETPRPERVWKFRALSLIGLLAVGAVWLFWPSRPTPTRPRPMGTAPVAAAEPALPRVQPLPAPSATPEPQAAVTSPDPMPNASEARRRGQRAAAVQLALRSVDDGTATEETGLLLANLGELARARLLLNTLSSASPPTNVDWLRVAVDLGSGAPLGKLPAQANSPEQTLVAARAQLRTGGPNALARFLDSLAPQLIETDRDLQSFRRLAQFGSDKGGPRYAFNLQKQASEVSPVGAFVAGWLAGDQRRLSAFWFSRALSGHGDRCLATRLYFERMKMLRLPVRRSIIEAQTAAGCSRL